MSASNKLIQAAAGVGGEETDADFANTVLLLNADDASNGGQNNTFLDSSSNTHTITRNGNVTQGSFSPFSVDDGKWGNYFDGSGDYLTAANNSAFAFGTGDFTIEAWVYASSLATRIIFTNSSGSGTANISFYITSDGKLNANNLNTVQITSTGTITANSWNHVAITKASGTYYFWINGTASGNHASLGNDNLTDSSCLIGARPTPTDYWSGYIASLRVVKGTAVYTSAFTPPTTPLTDVSGTSLLTCQSNRFVDNSSNAHSITLNGTPKVVPFSPFPQTTAYDASTNGGSGYFDGNSDYLSIADSDDFHIGASDFTLEGWIYKEDKGAFSSFIGQRVNATNEWRVILDIDTVSTYIPGNFRLEWGSSNLMWTSANIPNGAWTHFALVRSGTTGTLYINGTSVGTNTLNDIGNYSAPLRIGTNTGAGEFYQGYISNLRLVKGTAIAPSGVPTAPATDISGTSLLCNFTNASVFDSTGKNVLETVGNAQVDTTTVKYGTGSMEFDGTGDYLKIPYTPSLGFNGDFTVECWVNPTSRIRNNPAVWSNYTSYAGAGTALFAGHNSNTTKYTVAINGTFPVLTSTSSIDYGNWTHIAIVRSGTTVDLYINGSSEDSATVSAAILGTEDFWFIGAAGDDIANSTLHGFIDDFRITKGIARYTANFTPPARALPVIGEE